MLSNLDSSALNEGLLPAGYYALAEQVTKPFGPDVLTLQTGGENGVLESIGPATGPAPVAVLENPPKVLMVQKSEADLYAKKANRVVIRHASDDRVVAMIEILSPGNKASRHAIDDLLGKVFSLLDQCIHLLLIDLFPPTSRDPQGIHSLIWGDSATAPPAELPLTLVDYDATSPCVLTSSRQR